MSDLIQQLKALQNKLNNLELLLSLPAKKQKILELEDQMQQPNFWSDRVQATKISQELSGLQNEIDNFNKIKNALEDLLILNVNEEDEKVKKELFVRFGQLEKDFVALEFKTLFTGRYDQQDAIFAIHAGTGGTDAQDWARMLERMYLRYAEKRGFQTKTMDRQAGNEAGIKSVIFEINGSYAYGYTKSEAGVHRLVRISPFDAEKMRHTSFALVEVLPVIDEEIDLNLKDEDLEIDVFRSSGHGGQSVNTTDSAVRIRHLPTGIVVSCQNERSQMQNKQSALRVLAARVRQYYETEQEEERKKLRGEFTEAVWGNQARSYVLQPYQLVKDHRTDFETADTEAILNGELDDFVAAYLKSLV